MAPLSCLLRSFIHTQSIHYQHLVLKRGGDVTKAEDYEPKQLANDDGEKYGSDRLLRVLKEEGASDVLVVCSRWYGGTMIGPIRFTHIETCAREAVAEYMKMEQVVALRQDLEGLDDLIEELRADLNGPSDEPVVAKKRPYQSWTEPERFEKLIKSKNATVRMLVDKVAAKKTQD